MSYIFYYLATIVPLAVLDGLWILIVSKKFYATQLGFLFSKSVNLLPVVVFYPVYALALLLLAVMPAVAAQSWAAALWRGALLGLAAYGAYDLTNHATIANWPTIVTVVDMLWGIVVSAATSVIAYYLILALK